MALVDSLLLTLPELVLTGAALLLMLVAAFAGDRATRLINAGAIAALVAAADAVTAEVGGRSPVRGL